MNMDKEMLELVNDLTKRPTTELALQIMELSSENLILEQQVKKQKEVIDKAIDKIEETQIRRYLLEQEEIVLNILKEVSE